MRSVKMKVSKPAPHRVAEYVRRLIRERDLKPGALLPTYEELCQALNLSYVTIKRGMDLLENEGLIRRIPSKGTFLAKDLSLRPRTLTKLGLIYSASRVSLFRDSYLREMVCGIMLGAQPGEIDLHIFSISRDGMVTASDVEDAGVDGVLLLGIENDDYLRTFSGWGTPGVVLDYVSSAVALDYVACDNAAGVRCALEYLAKRGHRRIAYLDGQSTYAVCYVQDPGHTLFVRKSSDVLERRAVIAEVRARGRLSEGGPALEVSSFEAPHDSAGVAKAWKQGPERPTAFLACDEGTAVSLIRELSAIGVRVPEDVSVCAVAGAGDARFEGHPLTYCRYDFSAMGVQAVRILAERCRKPGLQEAQEHRIGFTFVEGVTVGDAG